MEKAATTLKYVGPNRQTAANNGEWRTMGTAANNDKTEAERIDTRNNKKQNNPDKHSLNMLRMLPTAEIEVRVLKAVHRAMTI